MTKEGVSAQVTGLAFLSFRVLHFNDFFNALLMSVFKDGWALMLVHVEWNRKGINQFIFPC